MKTVAICALVIFGLIVGYNLRTRIGGPEDHPELLIPALDEHDVLAFLAAWYLKPGVYALWYLGLDGDSRNQLIIAALVSWWIWLMAVRLLRVVLFLK